MDTALVAGYPKSGNTLLGQVCNLASGKNIAAPFDIYLMRRRGQRPTPHRLFASPTCTIKSHQSKRYADNIDRQYFGSVASIVTLIRNPFETLLSSLNYLRAIYQRNHSSLPVLAKEALQALIPGYVIHSSFLHDFKLEVLRDAGLLSVALNQFAQSGTVIRNFYMAGAWSDFVHSYVGIGKPILHLRYEELALESLGEDPSCSQCSQLLSNFWDWDYVLLTKAFVDQGKATRKMTAKGNIFFSKAQSGYWRDYFSLDECRNFADTYHLGLVRNGYQDLLDELFPHYWPSTSP